MPIPLIVVGAVILLFTLACLTRIRLTVTLRDEPEVKLRILCFTLRRYPSRKKLKWRKYSRRRLERLARKKAKKLAKQKAKAAKRQAEGKAPLQDDEPNVKPTLTERIRLIRAVCAALFRKTNKHLRLHAAKLHINVATGDAARTAVLYGAVCQSLAYLLALLDRITRLRAVEPDVAVNADFLGERSTADVRLELSVRLGGALLILLGVMPAYVKAKLDRKQRRKQKERKAARAAGEQASQKG